MQIYPAIKANMGDWNYYIVRMKMNEIANEIKFAHDIYDSNTLNDAIQRTLDEGRVKREIVSYLANRKDRFFSSIVVASVGGNPTWDPVVMDTTVSKIIANASSMRDGFGVLSFDEAPRYYALDGQHRVAAIKSLVNPNRDLDISPPLDFDKDYVTVIVILREEHEELGDMQWVQRYRRLFSSLNRYAKPTDKDTNIIMDEDDLFAILTRRLISDHEYFCASSEQKGSFKVKTKGDNLLKKDRHFTTLRTLYAMNYILLTTKERRQSVTGNARWIDIQTRPSEEEIEEYYMELSNYWNAILEVVPVLHSSPSLMRVIKQDETDEEGENHFLFRPIGQKLFADIVRDVLDVAFPDKGCGSVDEMINALHSIAKIPWDLHDTPWKHLVLVQGNNKQWSIRSEERKKVLVFSHKLLRWYLNIDQLDEDQTNDLKNDWIAHLYSEYDEDKFNNMWNKFFQNRVTN